jgi:proline iminopeptidase
VLVPIGDVELYVHESGAGRPLFLLHGGPGLDGSVFSPALDPLAAEGWRLLAVDHRGNGRSGGDDPATWTTAQMADDLEALIGALGLERPVVLGWSFGTFVAQAHMVRHGSADAYVLVATIAEPGALAAVAEQLAHFEPERLRRQVTDSWAREATVQTAEEARQLLDDQVPFHLADPEGPLLEAARQSFAAIVFRPAVLRHFAVDGDYGLVDHRDALRSFEKPVLVLSGEHDRACSPASAHELAELLPRGEEVVVPDAAHLLLLENPAVALGALRSFLARV